MYKQAKPLIILFVLIVAGILTAPNVLAQSGCCSWHGGVSYCATSVGRYVCNDGTYSPSCGCMYVPPKPICGKNAYYDSAINSCRCNTGYCVGLNNVDCVKLPINAHCVTSTKDVWLCDLGYVESGNSCITCKAGYCADSNGKKCINMPDNAHCDYSLVSNWACDVGYELVDNKCSVVSSSRYEPVNTNTLQSPDNQQYSSPLIIEGLLVIIMVIAISVGFVYMTYAIGKWIILYISANEWTHGLIFFGAVIAVIVLFSGGDGEKGTQTNNTRTSQYTCNCSKTCPSMTCAEAYYQLNVCGCSQRDGDGDGVPCEAQCR